MTATGRRRLIVGITGASGVDLWRARPSDAEGVGHRDSSGDEPMGRAHPCPRNQLHARATVQALASVVHPIGDQGASISSGSFVTMGMLIAPCSVRTLAAIAHGLGG